MKVKFLIEIDVPEPCGVNEAIEFLSQAVHTEEVLANKEVDLVILETYL